MCIYIYTYIGFPSGTRGKEPTCQCRRCKRKVGSISESGRSPGRNGNSIQYSCLENLTDIRAWWATAHRVAKSWT